MKNSPCWRSAGSATVALTAWLCSTTAHAVEEAQITNPIGRVARMFNSRLVEVEDRVEWLQRQIRSLAKAQEHSLKSAIGYRGARLNPQDADPTITLDLGAELPLDQVYLIPSQKEPSDPDGLFPRRFSILASKTADFSTMATVYTSGSNVYPSPDISPLKFTARGITARYVRLVVHSGRERGVSDLFDLAEIVVVSNSKPVSFGAAITSTGAMPVPGLWAPEYIADGRTPLGIWQSGPTGKSKGDLQTVAPESGPMEWSVDCGSVESVDWLVLFPYELTELAEGAVLPGEMTVWISDQADGSQARKVEGISLPVGEVPSKVPFVIPLHGVKARSIRIASNRAWKLGDRSYQGLAEVEVWSGTKNLAAGKPVTRTHEGRSISINTLTDGFASQPILSVAAWLIQLNERRRLESELASLNPIRQQMVQESELNVTWGSAVALGLTFLIPVVIVERRRLISKNQLDQLRKRIASDLHDDIGSNLGSISLIARTAKKDLVRLQGPEELMEDLGEVESIARESSLAMRDIVWLLERRQDSIGDLVQRMRETAGRLLREVDYTIECKSTKVASKLTLDAKRHLFLFYKEAVHNIVKHSRAHNVIIRLKDQGERLVLEVHDDGIGLPTQGQARASSVQKLQERAHVLEGQLEVESETGVGTLLRLIVRRAHLIARPNLS